MKMEKVFLDYCVPVIQCTGGINRKSHVDKDGEPPTATMEQEKRMRREIANSNERRRMQSINNGFQSLRSLLPHHEGEKLSKAAILQQTAEYIYQLEQEKTRLLSQNCQLKRLVNQHEGGELPPKKRKTEVMLPISESSDEGLGSMSPEPINVIGVVKTSSDQSTTCELRRQLEQERNLRILYEEQLRQYENQHIIYQQQPTGQIYTVEDGDDLKLQLVAPESLPPVGHTQTVVCSPVPSRSPSPVPSTVAVSAAPEQQQRLPSVLEAAIKAEPKVEVERLPSPNTSPHEDGTTTTTTIPARLYSTNTSRQNLETIVEAIRHLEGDHMFGDEPQTTSTPQQEAPLALTTTTRSTEHIIKVEMNPYLDFHQVQQSRPGVIVVKQAS
ncbi:transcription factor AP-4 isoform X2 [Onthophagus taurus]|uniref:transcription factor AP-4 isoform X2 n=1 Tax=Onthophagus taurus TaxID=166361 RepID=UPI0039BEC3EF